MSSRDKILAKVLQHQPVRTELPELIFDEHEQSDAEFATILERIGGKVVDVKSFAEISPLVTALFPEGARRITTIPELSGAADFIEWQQQDAHQLRDVEVAIVRGHFGVAENGAIWVTDELLIQRVVPFIAQHLVVVLSKKNIVPDMHAAYRIIGNAAYDFATFIAGPSKTADIEQSLVLGAHGPKTMTVIVVDE